MLMNTERIDKALEPPWDRVDDRVKVRVPKHHPENHRKKHWAKRQGRMALGGGAEVYDAEMEGLARGAEATREWRYSNGRRSRSATHPVLCRQHGGNPAHIQRHPRPRPGVLKAIPRGDPPHPRHHPYLEIDISWVPGHQDIPGNDTADGLSQRELRHPEMTGLHYCSVCRQHLLTGLTGNMA